MPRGSFVLRDTANHLSITLDVGGRSVGGTLTSTCFMLGSLSELPEKLTRADLIDASANLEYSTQQYRCTPNISFSLLIRPLPRGVRDFQLAAPTVTLAPNTVSSRFLPTSSKLSQLCNCHSIMLLDARKRLYFSLPLLASQGILGLPFTNRECFAPHLPDGAGATHW